jgi:hypothetical protein
MLPAITCIDGVAPTRRPQSGSRVPRVSSNNYLAEQDKYNMLAGAKYIPVTNELHQDDGIRIMTPFTLTMETNPVVEEMIGIYG